MEETVAAITAFLKGFARKGLPIMLLIVLGVSLEWLLLTNSSPLAVVAAITGPLPTPSVHYQRPAFQTGIVFPQWGEQAYGKTDHNFAFGLGEIQQQTAAHWVEITVNLAQAAPDATDVGSVSYTPTPQSIYEGIMRAHKMGYKVFIVPLISVGQNIWSGYIHFGSLADAQTWFANYWRAYAPYIAAAQRAHADQVAIGTELTMLEQEPAALWNTLIAKAHALYHGRLTYDMNWSTLDAPSPDWMRNPALAAIGVSEYLSLAPKREHIAPALLPGLWRSIVRRRLDLLALRVGKPVLISEIAYRNSADATFYPFKDTTPAPHDPIEQAAAYDAALQNVIADPLIEGIYFWGWSVPTFEPNWLPAAQTLHHWYTSPLA